MVQLNAAEIQLADAESDPEEGTHTNPIAAFFALLLGGSILTKFAGGKRILTVVLAIGVSLLPITAYGFPWGEEGIESNGSTSNTYGFTREQQFGEAEGLVYLRARYYDPNVGRFISRDPLVERLALSRDAVCWTCPAAGVDYPEQFWYRPQALHLYTYCQNNPVNHVDPTGEAVPIPPWFIVAAVMVLLGIIVYGGLKALCRGLYNHDERAEERACAGTPDPELPEPLKSFIEQYRKFCKSRGWYRPVEIGDIV